MDDVAGESLGDRTSAELAGLVREYLLAGQLIDRAGMPHVLSAAGADVMGEVAIDEWMGASPIYTARMQRLLQYEGDDVETIFKGLQLDVGSPPQFMDFRFEVHDADHGEFWLDSCGALMDVEPMGDRMVHTMCHAIEDPTFDATAIATNPRAQVRPVHRPPRQPADRHPHCRWTVTIDPSHAPVAEPDVTKRMRATHAGGLDLPSIPAEGPGWRDYRRPLEPDLDLEAASTGTLLAIADEVCLQGHLLVMSFLAAVEARLGAERAVEIGRRQLAGVGGVVAKRLDRWLGPRSEAETAAGRIATVLDLHPAFRPRTYVDLEVVPEDAGLLVVLGDGPALREPRESNWAKLLADGWTDALDAMAQAVDPRARFEPTRPDGAAAAGGMAAWRLGFADRPAPPSADVTLTEFSTGAAFEFRPR